MRDEGEWMTDSEARGWWVVMLTVMPGFSSHTSRLTGVQRQSSWRYRRRRRRRFFHLPTRRSLQRRIALDRSALIV